MESKNLDSYLEQIEAQLIGEALALARQNKAQAEIHTMSEIGMQLGCELGHKTTVIVKFNIAEVTFFDAVTGRVFRHDKFREVKPQRTMAH